MRRRHRSLPARVFRKRSSDVLQRLESLVPAIGERGQLFEEWLVDGREDFCRIPFNRSWTVAKSGLLDFIGRTPN